MNNPTIDGVSRETIERTLHALSLSHCPEKILMNDLRALLDAPDICPTCDSRGAGCPDCKPEPEPSNDLREHCKQCAEIVKTWPEWKQNCLAGAPAVELQEPVPSQVPVLRAMAANYRNGHQWDFLDGEAVNKAADEITTLQSTIAQLQARIAELESGRGEPVAWMCMSRDGYAQRCTKTDPEGFPVYRASPAPVAVMVDEQQAFANWTHEVIGMCGLAKVQRRDEMTVEQEKYAMKGWLARACLDATAVLNGVRE